MERLDRKRAEFEHLYLRKGLALRGVAEALGVSVKMLTLWMDERKIPRRNRAQAQHNRSRRLGKADQVVYYRLSLKMTMEQIADLMGYSSKGTVHSILAYRGLDGPLETLPPYEDYIHRKKRGRLKYVCHGAGTPAQAGSGGDEEGGDPEQG
jgi:transcriptional regulator with XRE-family HTH domain